MRSFDTGATRNSEDGKLDFEGFLSPYVLERYAEYMHKNRKQTDGKLRDSDNWQKGIPVPVYMKSLWRHFFAVWKGYRAGRDITEDLCAVLFNTMGMLHELLTRSPSSRVLVKHASSGALGAVGRIGVRVPDSTPIDSGLSAGPKVSIDGRVWGLGPGAKLELVDASAREGPYEYYANPLQQLVHEAEAKKYYAPEAIDTLKREADRRFNRNIFGERIEELQVEPRVVNHEYEDTFRT